MIMRSFALLLVALSLLFPGRVYGQQTLGGIAGTVTDGSGALLSGAVVTVVDNQTGLTRTETTSDSGAYLFVDLPIGSYTVTFTHAGFERQDVPSISVQANRTMTVNAALRVGGEETTITVNESPLVNAFDTTNGYVLDKEQFEKVPLATGSFTGVAILSPGVSAELAGGTGANQGLGNQPIWANGQRDTSNTFLVNGVDASNLFNGKSTSSVASARIVNNTGVAGASSTTAEVMQTTASPYLAIGEALPTPAPETVEEFRVNTSMYDAQQGSTSGAHIDMSTASGTNKLHGSAYAHRGTDWLNAAPYFYKQDPNIPPSEDVPQLHRSTEGGTLGGPLIKNKVFGFIAYQHVHVSDTEIGTSRTAVPFGMTDDRSPQALANVANRDFPAAATNGVTTQPVVGNASGDISPVAFAMLNYKLPNGQYLIPSANPSFTPTLNFPENVFLTQPAYFISDQAVTDVDYLASSKDTLSLKYYYQHDPTRAPFGYSSVEGFTQQLDAGSQVASITNTQSITPHLSIAEVLGFIREKIYSTIGQPFTPGQLGINAFGSRTFPGITIVDDLGNYSPANANLVFNAGLNIGSTGASQGAFTGIFQNRWMPSADASWTHGRHTFTFGGSFSYTQLNARDDRTNKGMIGFADFSQFLQGLVTSYSSDGFITTAFLQGDANRYYRSREWGAYLQDKFQVRPNLSFSAGIRLDDHGGLSEKNGRIFNFDPSRYDYDFRNDTIVANGFIVAGNNPDFPTRGVSDSTLTGRQWGLAPRFGLAWSPKRFNDKVVVRSGWGMYYDRGELFAYLSPGFAAGVIPAGPFGVNQSPPWVNSQVCSATLSQLYLFFVPECDPGSPAGGSFSNPWGAALGPAPSGNPAKLVLPNLAAVENLAPLFAFADYNRSNQLPYSMNQTLDIQWQPRRDLAIEIGYVGNLGRHQVIPVPFNQAAIATPTHPVHGQNYTYGYTVLAPPGCNPALNPGACAYSPTCTPAVGNQPANTGGCQPMGLPDGTTMMSTYTGGNVDLRTPYVGYSSESESYTAAGVSAYNALAAHVEKRMSHGIQAGFSYTYSHATDEQSAMGLFYNGDNPLNLRSGYGLADFDRTHVINFTFVYELRKFFPESSVKGKIADGWALSGLSVIQSGQPYSVIDYSGAVGSIFYSTNDGITNPVVPLQSCSPGQAMTGASGTLVGKPALNAACFGMPQLNPGALNGAIPPGDTYETDFIDHGQRNIFRQSWQKRADISLVKITPITEHSSLRYSFDVFNVTNTASFDIPIDDVSQNLAFNGFPLYGTSLYSSPTASGLGITNKTIGSPRQIQMSLRFSF